MLALKYYYNTHYNLYKAIVLIDLFKLQKTFKTNKLPYFATSSDHVPKYILYSKGWGGFWQSSCITKKKGFP